MRRQDQSNEDHSDTNTNKSCPTVIEEDVTQSMNEQTHRVVRSQQFLPYQENSTVRDNDTSRRQSTIQALRNSPIGQRPTPQSKIDANIINKKGTDFDCQKVQSIELSIQEASHRSGSLKNRSNRNSQQQIEEPQSGRKSRREEGQKFKPIENYRQNDIKQEVLNILLAGAQDTGKSTFKCCFKRKYRKFDEPHIKRKTREIKYEQTMVDQNLLNKRNSICFIDLAGFASNQEDKYMRQIQQYATARWRNFEEKPEEDGRIHCCLYFIRGPRIKQSDINMMKKLSSIFNLIPVIAKSDHYTKDEILEMKQEFHRKIAAAGRIDLYDLKQFYLLKLGTDRIDEALRSNFGQFPPFAIASSVERQSLQGHNFVRKYPWGRLEIQNEEHTDFERLCELLSSDVRTHFLTKLVHLPEIEEAEIVQEVIGELGNQVVNEQDNDASLWDKIKKNLIVGTMLCAFVGFLFLPKMKVEILDSTKITSA